MYDALVAVLHAFGDDSWLGVVLQVIGLASAIAALLPHPAPDSRWAPIRAALDSAAMNLLNAKNKEPKP
jgi:hypothetical protein